MSEEPEEQPQPRVERPDVEVVGKPLIRSDDTPDVEVR